MARDSINSKGQNWWGRHSPIDESIQNRIIKLEPYPGKIEFHLKLCSRSMVIMGFHFFKIIVSDRWGKNWRRARRGGRETNEEAISLFMERIRDTLTWVCFMKWEKVVNCERYIKGRTYQMCFLIEVFLYFCCAHIILFWCTCLLLVMLKIHWVSWVSVY